jgi:ABC-type nitrate/sulfonate/bicarbonate transport system permease component
MVQTGALVGASRAAVAPQVRVLATRLASLAGIFIAWEIIARSGLLFGDVVPPLGAIALAIVQLLIDPSYYFQLGITIAEIAAAIAIGGLCGLVVGIVLGANRFLARAYEPFIHYLAPTPKIIFFPVMIMWFGVGSPSKVALGALSSFFPVAISAAGGMREIDKVLIRVGRSFRLSSAQMATKIYLPAMRQPVVNGFRIGFGLAVIGTLLAETKLSNQGIGYLILQAYATFDMRRMYALLILLFVLAVAANALIGRLAVPRRAAMVATGPR